MERIWKAIAAGTVLVCADAGLASADSDGYSPENGSEALRYAATQSAAGTMALGERNE